MGLDDDGDKYDPPGVKVSSLGVKVSSPSGVAQCVAQGSQRESGSCLYLAALLSFIAWNTLSPGPVGAQPSWMYMAASLCQIDHAILQLILAMRVVGIKTEWCCMWLLTYT